MDRRGHRWRRRRRRITGSGACGGDARNRDILEPGWIELDADACEHGLGGEDWQAGEVRHHEAVGMSGIRRCYEQIDAGPFDALGFGLRVLSQDRAGVGSGPGNLGGSALFEAGLAEVESGCALLSADDVGDFYLLRAEAVGDADMPVAANDGVGGRGLGEDMPGGDFGGVVVVVNVEVEAQTGGLAAGLGDGHAAQIGDAHLGAVDSELHGQHG